jgi:hypothetical protein
MTRFDISSLNLGRDSRLDPTRSSLELSIAGGLHYPRKTSRIENELAGSQLIADFRAQRTGDFARSPERGFRTPIRRA